MSSAAQACGYQGQGSLYLPTSLFTPCFPRRTEAATSEVDHVFPKNEREVGDNKSSVCDFVVVFILTAKGFRIGTPTVIGIRRN